MPSAPARSIRIHLIALIAGVALPLLGLLAWDFWSDFAQDRASARDLALRIARSVASDLEQATREAQALVARVAKRPNIGAREKGGCDPLFPAIDFLPRYVALESYDASGRLICSSVVEGGEESLVYGAISTVRNVVGGGAIPPRPLLIAAGGEWLLASFAPIIRGGAVIGSVALVQAVDVPLRAYPSESVATIVDDGGKILARSNDPEKWVGRNLSDLPTGPGRLPLGVEGSGEWQGVDGVARQYGVANVPGTRWHVFVGIPTDVVMAEVQRLALRGAIAGLLIIGVILLLGLRVARSVARPLNTLAMAVQHVGEVGYSAAVPIAGPREVEVLGEAFNEMVARRAEAETALRSTTRELEALSERLIAVQEDERTRIAREIHDELGQLLTALKIDVGGLIEAREARPGLEAMVARIRSVLDQSFSAVHRIAAELRPPALDDFGFLAAIESDVGTFEARTGIECDLSLPGEPISLTPSVESAAYRIFQEAMTNVARHANATRVEIRLRVREGEVLLDIRDDGRGIAEGELQRPGSFGMLGMRERARQVGATLDVQGIPGRGTIIALRIPSGSREAIA